jgi:hypothetical protein
MAECPVVSPLGRIKCQSPDKLLNADFKPVPATPNAVRFKVKMARRQGVAPFKAPLTGVLSYGSGVDRVGEIADCKLSNVKITCKEF